MSRGYCFSCGRLRELSGGFCRQCSDDIADYDRRARVREWRRGYEASVRADADRPRGRGTCSHG